MGDKVRLEVVTPARAMLSVETDEVVGVPGRDGMVGVLPGHTPFMATLAPGIVSWLTAPDKESGLVVAGGFVVVQDDVVTVLAEQAELPGEVNVDAAKRDITEAPGRIAATTGDEQDAARDVLALAEARVEAAAQWGG
ncbi:MAG: ATP synthase F1 subunit epsilon [Nitrospirota bacterium]|nr:ATP synthase F1 subunit epsilon [Nitrospirota bacterium]